MRLLPILAAATAVLSATPVTAEPPAASAANTLAVHYADLDLATANGIATLDRRIRSTIEAACGPTSEADPAGKNRVRACLKANAAEVRAQRERVLVSAARKGATRLASTR